MADAVQTVALFQRSGRRGDARQRHRVRRIRAPTRRDIPRCPRRSGRPPASAIRPMGWLAADRPFPRRRSAARPPHAPAAAGRAKVQRPRLVPAAAPAPVAGGGRTSDCANPAPATPRLTATASRYRMVMALLARAGRRAVPRSGSPRRLISAPPRQEVREMPIVPADCCAEQQANHPRWESFENRTRGAWQTGYAGRKGHWLPRSLRGFHSCARSPTSCRCGCSVCW